MSAVNNHLVNLLRDQRGNTMMTFGLTSMIAVAAVGGAIDFGRSYNMKSKMQNALDVAVVSGIAKYRETQDWTQAKTHAAAVFQTNFANAVSPTVANPNPTPALDQPLVTFAQNGTQLTGTATMTANTPFMNLVIGSNLTLNASSAGMPPSGKMLEVAVMVDVTGSMGWAAPAGATPTDCNIVDGTPDKKIEYLQCAAEDLLNILLPTSGANNNSVKIGIAPFSDKVNAGEFAASVVDPSLYPATGGAYVPKDNLAQTKQGPFTGTYAVAGVQPSGSQFGAMGATATSGATVTDPGATFVNGYCSNPGGVAATMHTRDGLTYGVRVSVASGHSYSGAAPVGLALATSSARYARANRWNTSWGAYWLNDGNYWYNSTSSGYYVPMVSSTAGLTVQRRTADGKTGDVGVGIYYSGSSGSPSVPAYLKSNNTGGFWRVTGIKSDGTFNYVWDDDVSSDEFSYYLPIYTSYTTAVTSGCESTTTTASSKLITCVTERREGTGLNYTADAIGAGKYIGPYNHGSSSKSNYSSDGKCYSAGRELAPVIPLTNSRSTLTSFFENITVGGATAGHIGTAWASYLLSPDWSGIWPSSSTPAAYANTGVNKAAILMTDGQYNIQFSVGGSATNVSSKQALMICKEMRSKGIHVYTVGFGFAANATPPTTNVEAMSDTERTTPLATGTNTDKALDTLAKCASSNSSYYFPYDGESLRTVFKSIANGLAADLNGNTARLTY